MASKGSICSTVVNFGESCFDFYLSRNVPIIDRAPSPLSFVRDWVGKNRPVLIRNAMPEAQWPALSSWTLPELQRRLGGPQRPKIDVAWTPNGYADAVDASTGCFVMPEERSMDFSDFVNELQKPEEQRDGVMYIQRQNSNFTEDAALAPLRSECPLDVGWASEALDRVPDAVNFWLGDSRAVTSMHKDQYENLYAVVRGWKKFLLVSPCQAGFVPYQSYPAAVYRASPSSARGYLIERLAANVSPAVPWVSLDPTRSSAELRDEWPLFAQHVHTIEVTVCAGEMLYLPALWFHHVRQSHGCIAVNYWYDMEFDWKYTQYQLLDNLKQYIS